jgi:hypothetical protein
MKPRLLEKRDRAQAEAVFKVLAADDFMLLSSRNNGEFERVVCVTHATGPLENLLKKYRASMALALARMRKVPAPECTDRYWASAHLDDAIAFALVVYTVGPDGGLCRRTYSLCEGEAQQRDFARALRDEADRLERGAGRSE